MTLTADTSAAPDQAPAPAAAPAPARPWMPVGRSERRPWSQRDLDYWSARDSDGTIVRNAIENGLLTDIGVGPRRRRYGRPR